MASVSRAAVAESVERRIPGESGVWIFILGDMLLFALLFALFVSDQSAHRAIFLSSQSMLNKSLGLINTALLLTSSWFVALGVESARRERWKDTSRLLALGALCGSGFVLVKGIEYAEKIARGISLNTDPFFSYYFMITGIHFLHVIVGLAVLVFLSRGARDGTLQKHFVLLESGACYWHMVDVLWIAIYTLIYLVR